MSAGAHPDVEARSPRFRELDNPYRYEEREVRLAALVTVESAAAPVRSSPAIVIRELATATGCMTWSPPVIETPRASRYDGVFVDSNRRDDAERR